METGQDDLTFFQFRQGRSIIFMDFAAACATTAMGIMPHKDVEKALALALSLDIPFWPQLPHLSLYEDMYIQTSQNFPGIEIDLEKGKIVFSSEKFYRELDDYFSRMDDPETYELTSPYSLVWEKFLAQNLEDYRAIRGQVTGPVSFGFKVLDENLKPIIYHEEAKAILFDFVQKKVNGQYQKLKVKNKNAFVWVDEPGLGYIFSGLSGYNELQAKKDYDQFMQGLEGPKGLHLCAEVNLPYLLELGVKILSFDAWQMGFMPKEYVQSVADFISRGGVISWGIVPTEFKILASQNPENLADVLLSYWEVISKNSSLSLEQIAAQALLAPARCCLVDLSIEAEEGQENFTREEKNVEQSFAILRELSQILKQKWGFK